MEFFLTSINIDEKCGQIKHHLISINPILLALRKLEIENGYKVSILDVLIHLITVFKIVISRMR